jgi:hypothetical protein
VESITLALIARLVQTGGLDPDDIEAIAESLGDDAAHLVRCCVLDAMAPSQSEWDADKARARFTAISGGKDTPD